MSLSQTRAVTRRHWTGRTSPSERPIALAIANEPDAKRSTASGTFLFANNSLSKNH